MVFRFKIISLKANRYHVSAGERNVEGGNGRESDQDNVSGK